MTTEQTTQRSKLRTSLGVVALLLVVFVATGTVLLLAQGTAIDTGSLAGTVHDKDGPVIGASVRVQATEYQTITSEDGSFALHDLTLSQPITLVAWLEGYTFGVARATLNQDDVEITLKAHHQDDNLDYMWETSKNCGECHTANEEWRSDAHGQSAINHRFLTMYNGTDVEGNRGRKTNYDQGLPRAIDPDKPYYGPGFKLDFPLRDGNCAACHTPLAGTDLPTDNTCGWSGCHMYTTAENSDEIPPSVSPLELTEVANEGISCDFCHKIGDVALDPETGLPDHEYPGILSMSIYRPEPEERFFFGSINDVARDTDTYNPLHKESAFCASCHFGVFAEVPVYNSYGEWLESDYSDPDTGKTCQDCHMPVAEQYESDFGTQLSRTILTTARNTNLDLPPLMSAVLSKAEKNYFVWPDKGGVYRDPDQVHTHLMPGASDETFLQNAVTMNTDAQLDGAQVAVSVQITNDQTGHHVPTGSPLRHVILVVQATDNDGNLLPLESGPLLPDWTGNYADLPGKGFAKILKDTLTGEEPTLAHWRNITLTVDSRIPALATDVTEYRFDAPTQGPVIVETRLIFRRAFQQLMEWKGWKDPDIVMEENKVVIQEVY